jgi:hypothetical protein
MRKSNNAASKLAFSKTFNAVLPSGHIMPHPRQLGSHEFLKRLFIINKKHP